MLWFREIRDLSPTRAMFESALICTDFTDGLQRLVNFVPDLAAGGLQQITFCHGVPLWEEGEIPRIDEAGIKEAQNRLTVPSQQALPPVVDVAVEVKCGEPVGIILQAAETYQPQILLLGTAHRDLLNKKLFGSTTLSLTQRLKCPLLALRPQLISTYTREELALRCRHLFRCLLIPYDGGPAADYLVEQIKTYAQNRPPNSLEACLLLWVVEEGGRHKLTRDHELQAAQQALASVQTDLESLGLRVTSEVQVGEPLSAILAAAATHDVSAIAITSKRLNPLVEWSIPKLSNKILRQSWHPVLFFPAQS